MSTTKKRTNFYKGLTSIIEVMPRSTVCAKYMISGQRSDWDSIGKDMRSAMGKFNEQQRKSIPAAISHSSRFANTRTGSTAKA